MRPIIWKPVRAGMSTGSVAVPATRSALAAYATEYRRAMLAARQVERLTGHLEQAALLLKEGYAGPDR